MLQNNGMGERLKKMYRRLDTPVPKRLAWFSYGLTCDDWRAIMNYQ